MKKKEYEINFLNILIIAIFCDDDNTVFMFKNKIRSCLIYLRKRSKQKCDNWDKTGK